MTYYSTLCVSLIFSDHPITNATVFIGPPGTYTLRAHWRFEAKQSLSVSLLNCYFSDTAKMNREFKKNLTDRLQRRWLQSLKCRSKEKQCTIHLYLARPSLRAYSLSGRRTGSLCTRGRLTHTRGSFVRHCCVSRICRPLYHLRLSSWKYHPRRPQRLLVVYPMLRLILQRLSYTCSHRCVL